MNTNYDPDDGRTSDIPQALIERGPSTADELPYSPSSADGFVRLKYGIVSFRPILSGRSIWTLDNPTPVYYLDDDHDPRSVLLKYLEENIEFLENNQDKEFSTMTVVLSKVLSPEFNRHSTAVLRELVAKHDLEFDPRRAETSDNSQETDAEPTAGASEPYDAMTTIEPVVEHTDGAGDGTIQSLDRANVVEIRDLFSISAEDIAEDTYGVSHRTVTRLRETVMFDERFPVTIETAGYEQTE